MSSHVQLSISYLQSEIKPKYINELLSSAATRRLDHLRAEEKMMQREREAEGDMYQDKEKFVTQAYKDQMEEVRRAEEEEKRREGMFWVTIPVPISNVHAELQKKQRGQTSGMAHFYRKLLDESEASHEATVAATQKKVQGPQGPAPNLTIVKPPELLPLSDLQLAELARAEGKDVELNDDNQIVDRRELLAAGLNLSGINTRKLGGRMDPTQKSDEPAQSHRAVGTAASRREINERRNREIHEQMRAEKGRVALEKRKAEEQAIQRTVSRRNNTEDVSSARERYLQRKRQKMDEVVASESIDK
jgi:coiled-coil domain-containing protein 55